MHELVGIETQHGWFVPGEGVMIRKIYIYPANLVTYCPLHCWGEWRRDGPTNSSFPIQTLTFYLTDSGGTSL
eukprot:6179521-Pleurochrysis_carterae.AAC.2